VKKVAEIAVGYLRRASLAVGQLAAALLQAAGARRSRSRSSRAIWLMQGRSRRTYEATLLCGAHVDPRHLRDLAGHVGEQRPHCSLHRGRVRFVVGRSDPADMKATIRSLGHLVLFDRQARKELLEGSTLDVAVRERKRPRLFAG
jgi:hypothetical protein